MKIAAEVPEISSKPLHPISFFCRSDAILNTFIITLTPLPSQADATQSQQQFV
jgi:hypothetical protein